jgi:hypothetical protein
MHKLAATNTCDGLDLPFNARNSVHDSSWGREERVSRHERRIKVNPDWIFSVRRYGSHRC